jgi:DNA (cytosine-5)-methyltransferase 1
MHKILLDTFCKAGGATKGYQRAGFYVVGVDIEPQPHYCGDEFIQADALEFIAQRGREFDAIHASPPCQRYSLGSQRWSRECPDLLGDVEVLLIGLGVLFVIENVERAPFTLATITLCGIQFGLNVIRHRRFASSAMLWQPPHTKRHPKRGEFVTCAGHGGNGSNKFSTWCDAMGITWMSKKELAESIPPAYTEFIGRQLMAYLEASND